MENRKKKRRVKRQVKDGIARNNVQTCQKSDRWGPRPLRSSKFRKREDGGEEWTPDDKLPGRRGRPPRPSRRKLAAARCRFALQAAGCSVLSNCQPWPWSGTGRRARAADVELCKEALPLEIEKVVNWYPSSRFYESQDRSEMRCAQGTPRFCPRWPWSQTIRRVVGYTRNEVAYRRL
jgi:hypothetical protein